jgi:hypothetical protein
MGESAAMRPRQPLRLAAGALIAALLVAGCGGSSPSSAEKQFLARASLRCSALLASAAGAADSTKTDAPRDDVLAHAQLGLARSSQALLGLDAPATQRRAQIAVANAQQSGSRAIGQYLTDKQVNVSATSTDYNAVVQQLSQLQQVASGYQLKSCSLPVQ